MKIFLSIFKLVFVILVVSTTTKAATTKASTTFSTVTTECLSAFRAAALAQHNTLRAKHGAQQMTQDSKFDSSALAYAKYLASSGTFDHSNGDYGENLYYEKLFSSGLTLDICKRAGVDCVDAWYSEISDYDFINHSSNPMLVGHFTQVVWNSSTKLGMGLALGSGRLYCVGQYYKAGNWGGEYQKNVFPVGYKTPATKTTKSSATTTKIGKTTKGPATTTRAKTTTTTKSSATFSTVTAECLAAFRAAALSQHNTLRAKHKAQAMTQDPSIDSSALKYAKYLASSGTFDHSDSKYGENLYYQSHSSGLTLGICTKTALDCVNAWYNEIKKYSFSSPGFSMSTGHFTQVVWNSSNKLGMGLAFGSGRLYCVGQYSPAGNYEGQYKQNVFRLA